MLMTISKDSSHLNKSGEAYSIKKATSMFHTDFLLIFQTALALILEKTA